MGKKKIQEQLVTNRKMAESDPIFKQACEKAGLEPTRRQYSKWRMKKGKAYKMNRGIL